MFVFKKIIKIQGERYMFAYMELFRGVSGCTYVYTHVYTTTQQRA